MKVKFRDWDCETQWAEYRGDGGCTLPRLTLVHTQTREPIAVATLYIPDPDVADKDRPHDALWVKDYSENHGMVSALAAAGVIHRSPIGLWTSGFVHGGVYAMTDEALDEYAVSRMRRGEAA